MLHTPLEANDGYIWRGLPDLSKQPGEPELVVLTTSTSTFTLRTVTQGVRMLEMEINPVTDKLMDAFSLQNCHAQAEPEFLLLRNDGGYGGPCMGDRVVAITQYHENPGYSSLSVYKVPSGAPLTH